MSRVIVIGGGPAGMMAAIASAGRGNVTTLLEKNSSLGKKLLITGKGRCNVTNSCPLDGFIANTPVHGRFLYSALKGFSNQDLMQFFESRGVPLKEERGGRIFPVSDKSADVLAALKAELAKKRVTVLNKTVRRILTQEGSVCGVETVQGETISCNRVILATGGKSYPLTGSTGDGYSMAEALGHKVTPLKPSLVPLETQESWVPSLQGLSLRNTGLKVLDPDSKKTLFEDFGEMLFTHYGVSGPIILSASAFVRDISGKVIELDLKPGLTEEKLEERVLRDFEKFHNKNFQNSLTELLPAKLIPIVVQLSGISGEKKVNQISRQERRQLTALLKHFSFTVSRPRPIEEAIVTSGGIDIKQINPTTMESKLIKGLFFAGEIIDVDAYTGGFNLQIAFSTGWAAGTHAE